MLGDKVRCGGGDREGNECSKTLIRSLREFTHLLHSHLHPVSFLHMVGWIEDVIFLMDLTDV